jgi:hypothetical protein
MVQDIEHLPSKHEALSSMPSAEKKKKKKLVECLPNKCKVLSSTPTTTKEKKKKGRGTAIFYFHSSAV